MTSTSATTTKNLKQKGSAVSMTISTAAIAAVPQQPKKTINVSAVAIIEPDSPTSSITSASTNTGSNGNTFFKIRTKTDHQHILENPDTYIGSVEHIEADMWIVQTQTQTQSLKQPAPSQETGDSNNTVEQEVVKVVEKNICYVPGLFKLFDEGIVNCRDHAVRMKTKIDAGVENALPVTHIDITVDSNGTITMVNDGNGIDVVQDEETGIWVPEAAFAHLRSSSNFDANEERLVGGKNGYGFKLVMIWSKDSGVETVDHIRGLKYYQEFHNNRTDVRPPVITKCRTKPYTKIWFTPDYERLGLSVERISDDVRALFQRRAFDIAAITDKTVKVKYNGNLIPIKTFQQYVDLFIGSKDENPRVYESANERWEYAVALSPSHAFTQVSFVNGIHTSKGGKHVEYISNQIVKKLCDFILKKKKVNVNPATVREQLILFLRCDIINPAFDSQSKDFMNTPVAKFGSKCEVSDKFIEKLAKLGVMDTACALTDIKETRSAVRKTEVSRQSRITGISKLVDANLAGTARSGECTLCLCEGDSAKAAIISSLSPADRDIYGVYPLKGKLLNVRGVKNTMMSDNEEIADLVKILRLVVNKEYKTIDDVKQNLRYGRVMFITDQDLDGSHIKGLGINLFHWMWPSLTQIPGFICYMNTPIIKATRGATALTFYNDGEYSTWKHEIEEACQQHLWKIKYYKGLGTSTKQEFIEYFKNRKIVSFTNSGEECDDAIDMLFHKKRADERKAWLEKYRRDVYIDTNQSLIEYKQFINNELIHFSKYDCERSIPSLVDGLKISQRKILYSAFKRNLTSEIKVAQFSGYVSEHSCYHHGEASLNAAIVGMGQNYVGSNNINLLVPAGQFGTRLLGGKDAASPRYIFTNLEKITRKLFPEHDDNVLKYLEDDGTPVEPMFYVPIIPMVLVNGSCGIGTGSSTDIPCYNPQDIIEYLRRKLRGESTEDMVFIPWYDGFKGEVCELTPTKYLIKGVYERDPQNANGIIVSELPISMWTQSYKDYLEKLQADKDDKGKKIVPVIRSFTENCTDSTIQFNIVFEGGSAQIDELEGEQHAASGCNGLEKLMKLCTTVTTTNMNLFDERDRLTKYDTVQEIMDEYYEVRLECYDDRRTYLLDAIDKQLKVLGNKMRFILEILAETIDLRKKKKTEIVEMLRAKGYDVEDDKSADTDGYHYLVRMPMDSVSHEKVAKMQKEFDDMQEQRRLIEATTIEQMWLADLDSFEMEYEVFKAEKAQRLEDANEQAKSGASASAGKKGSRSKKATASASTTVAVPRKRTSAVIV